MGAVPIADFCNTRPCTVQLVYNSIAEALKAGSWRQQQLAQTMEPSDSPAIVDDEASLINDIERCAEFFIGVPSVIENGLMEFLQSLYGGNGEHDSGRNVGWVDFRRVHRVNSVVDVARLFPGEARRKWRRLHSSFATRKARLTLLLTSDYGQPMPLTVLVFPCIWTQHVLRVRTLGAATWTVLQRRRAELQPPSPTKLSSLFLSFSDIITLATTLEQQTHKSAQTKNSGVSAWLSTGLVSAWKRRGDGALEARREPLLVTPLVSKKHSERSHSSSGRASTPRKVVPVE